MNREAIIERTINAINLLPIDKAEEISDFVDFLTKKYEDHMITEGIQRMAAKSDAFSFLNNDDDLYTLDDLKEVYNG